ncbi:MAG: hypothetical protein HC850_13610 [Rhodomicrobium sp.]|nr:hypothetical protein [Rhodomicrobium sp.]
MARRWLRRIDPVSPGRLPSCAQNNEQIEIASRPELRAWLENNHAQTESIWLVTWKKGDPRHVPYGDVVEEALCFGWIDSLPRKLDGERSKLLLSPRKAGSAWSKANKDRVVSLTERGLMRSAGLAKVADAKRTGLWTKLDAVEALEIPADLADAFRAHPPAAENWDSFPRSVKRGILEWILQAKRPETRGRRVAETAAKAARNERANQWRDARGYSGIG